VLAVASVLMALAAGCGKGSSRPASASGKRDVIVSRLEPMTLPKVLPRQVCSVGIRSYDVMLFGVRLRQEDSCSRVADEVFRGERQLPWSREHYVNSDQVEECELARGGGRLQVLRGDPDFEGPRFDAAYDLTERACARLEREGWKIVFQEK
jgi:hypothetical protein